MPARGFEYSFHNEVVRMTITLHRIRVPVATQYTKFPHQHPLTVINVKLHNQSDNLTFMFSRVAGGMPSRY